MKFFRFNSARPISGKSNFTISTTHPRRGTGTSGQAVFRSWEMSFVEMLPIVRSLSRLEKLQLIQLLADDLA